MPLKKAVEMAEEDEDEMGATDTYLGLGKSGGADAEGGDAASPPPDNASDDEDIVAAGTRQGRKGSASRPSSASAASVAAKGAASPDGIPIDNVISHLERRTHSAQLYMDFFVYVPFLILFIFFSGRDVDANYYVVRVVKDRLMGNEIPTEEIEKHFVDLGNSYDWGRWASFVLVPNIWSCKFPEESFARLDAQGGNMLIGAMRLRTHRVRSDTCSHFNEDMLGAGHACYGSWDGSRAESAIRHYFPNPMHYPNHTLIDADMSELAYTVRYPVDRGAVVSGIRLLYENYTEIPPDRYTIYTKNVSGQTQWVHTPQAVLGSIGFLEAVFVFRNAEPVARYTVSSDATSNMRTMTRWRFTSRSVGGTQQWQDRGGVNLTGVGDWPVGDTLPGTLLMEGGVYPAVESLALEVVEAAYDELRDTAETPFLYRNRGCAHRGAVGIIRGDISSYNCGGYTVDLPFTASCKAAQDLTFALQSNNYPYHDNYATRFLSVEMFIYTFATDSFTSVKLFTEVGAAGSWVNKWQIHTFQVFKGDARRYFLDLFFLAFVIYFAYRFVADWRNYAKGHTPGSYETRGKPLRYLLDFWNILELGNLVCFIVVFVVEFMWMAESNNGMAFPFPSVYPEDLDWLLSLYMLKVSCNGINMVITFMKFLKYVRLNSRLNVLSATVACKAPDIMACLIVFVYVVFAFSLAGTALFGTTLKDYRDIGESYSTLMRMLLGDFDYDSLREENKYLAAAFFWAFIVIALFLLLSFLVAILSEGFAQVSGDISTVPVEEQFTKMWIGIKRSLRPSRLVPGIKMFLKGNSRHSVLVRCTTKIQDYRLMMHDLAAESPEDGVASSLIFRTELPAFMGEEEYDLLGDEFMDDVWDDIIYDWHVEQRSDEKQANSQNTDYVAEAVGASVKGTLEDVDHMWHKMLQLQEELNNLSSVLNTTLRPFR